MCHHAQLFTSVLGLELGSSRLDSKPLTAEPGLQRLCLFSSWLPHQLLLLLAHGLVSWRWLVTSLAHTIPLSPWRGGRSGWKDHLYTAGVLGQGMRKS